MLNTYAALSEQPESVQSQIIISASWFQLQWLFLGLLGCLGFFCLKILVVITHCLNLNVEYVLKFQYI